MRILGIDPGLRNMGWGVIDVTGARISHVANGVVHGEGEDLELVEGLVELGQRGRGADRWAFVLIDHIVVAPAGIGLPLVARSGHELAGEIESVGIIMVPAFNNHPQLHPKEARKVLVDLLAEIGEVAHKAGTRILLEPLNRGEAIRKALRMSPAEVIASRSPLYMRTISVGLRSSSGSMPSR